ncbi:site-specific DNA-methyltransferase [Agromyces tardus]|jgi:site-specific DNA-methyltransferase (adenine-specific)|uniref:Methyltransferase n=1 Tax=Agromyces tardus TaxID=2583849 RepID=A0A3M8A2F8_9MICO|nr:site-specific DNA-methyltransferase [Agromyces tardus]
MSSSFVVRSVWAPRYAGRVRAPGTFGRWHTGDVSVDDPDRVIHADNLDVLRTFPDGRFTLVYLDPPFNTGRPQSRQATRHVRQPVTDAAADAASAPGSAGAITGFQGKRYERIRGDLMRYDDRFDDYWAFLEPRLAEAWRVLADDGTLYLHLDYREAHYAKVLLDALFGRECFLNELIWAYDYGAKAKRRWPTKHDTILVYVKNPDRYWFDSSAVDREPYMAPGLVTPEKAELGKLPTDVWWHTIVSPTGREKTGYPTQKPEGVLRRIVQASTREGDWVLDCFAGSGTTGAVAATLGRRFVLVDEHADAIAVMRRRFAEIAGVEFEVGVSAG